MGKQAITQRSFVLGEIREEFLEGDDLEIRQQSCQKALNVRVTAARTLIARPGTFWARTVGQAYDLIELRPETGALFGLLINDGSLEVIDIDARAVFSVLSAPWVLGSEVWVETFRDETFIGGTFGIYILAYNSGAWSFSIMNFDVAAGGELAQPYWVFDKTISMRPSALTGSVTVTASSAFFTPAYVGLRIRYGQREILITGYTSSTVVSGTVVSSLPPSWRLTVQSTTGLRVGDAMVGADTDFQCLIIAIGVNQLDVVTTAFYDGPDINEKISGPSTTTKVTAKAQISPLASPLWDEPLMSVVRGYPRAGASAAGRLTLTDFPLVPDLICMSSNRTVKDFKVGAADDDAITRQCGDNAPRFLHVVNAGDLLLFSDRGLYYISLRDGGILTPANFNAVQFDKRASSSVRPVAVDDGVVFVEASGQAIAACLLDGNIYLKWSVRTISTYHAHLIKSPIKLCGPSQFAETPEKYLFVVNGDGTLAAVSWASDFSADSVGFIPWTTQGTFQTISPIFGGYWSIVNRSINGVTTRFIERFSDDAVMDCCVPIAATVELDVNGQPLLVNGVGLLVSAFLAAPLAGETVHVAGDGVYGGERDVALSGQIVELEDMPHGSFAGFNFISRVQPWPVEFVQSPRAGMLKARLIRGSVSLLSSGRFDVRANRNTRQFGGYSFGDDLSLPPPLRTKKQKFSVIGQRDHPEIEIIKPEPGAFEVLAITQEVQT